MTKKIAEIMGGEAGCDSLPDKGSIFWFTVRLKKA
jgi:two-component system, sensor histidine kinase and response regulator